MSDLQLARLRYLRARNMYLSEMRKAEAFVLRMGHLKRAADRPALLRPQV